MSTTWENFCRGIGSVLVLAPSLPDKLIADFYSPEDDSETLRWDWIAVGEDIRRATTVFADPELDRRYISSR